LFGFRRENLLQKGLEPGALPGGDEHAEGAADQIRAADADHGGTG
jgi:hypothetical protein